MGDWVEDWKITANEDLIPDWNSFQIHVPTILFSGDFSTYTLKYVNKTSHFANNLYFGHNERRFHPEFHSRVKFRSKFTWFRIDISFRIECSIRNEKWNELDPVWVATQSGFMQTNLIQSPMIPTETEWVPSGLKLSPDSCKHPPITFIGAVVRVHLAWPLACASRYIYGFCVHISSFCSLLMHVPNVVCTKM